MPPGVTVFDSASWNGIAIDSTCGGHGTCHKCKVQISGSSPITRHDAKTFTQDQLEKGWRLACLVKATRDLDVVVPPLTTRPKAATVGVGRQVILRPAVQKRYVELTEPTLEDQATDLDRLLAAITDFEPRPDLHVLRRLPKVLREADFKVTAVIVDEELVDVEPGDTTDKRYAIAFDLGTTTVVATLLDLVTGTPVAVASMLNKQQPFGGDVISRISATMLDPEALGRLQTAACDTLAQLAAQVCSEGGVDPLHVYEACIAGNATMTALVLGIDPEPIGVAPFIMTTAMPPTVLADELRLGLHPRARAVMFPALGAYVGGDIVAGMLASGHGPRQAHPAVHRRRHQLRDRAQRRRQDPLHRGARRPGVRGRRDPLRHARRRRRDRGHRAHRRPGRRRGRGQAGRDRRRRAQGAVRLRARRRRGRAGEGRPARLQPAASCPRRPPRSWPPGWPTGSR